MKKVPFILLLIVVLAACKEIYEPPPQALMEVSIEYSNPNVTTSPKVSVYGVDQDSIWIYQEQLRSFLLPLSQHSNSNFVLLLDSIADTLTVYHETTLMYGSVESGFYNEHWIQDIKHTFQRIDSVVVVDSAITKNWHENIQLYIGTVPAGNN